MALIETFFFFPGHRVFVHVYSFSVGHHCLFYLQDNPPHLSRMGKGDARCFQSQISKSHLFTISAFSWEPLNGRCSTSLALEPARLGR